MLKKTRLMKCNGIAPLTSFLRVAGVLARSAQGRDNPLPREQVMKHFWQMDRTDPPRHDALLFIGSSAICKWHTLVKDFPGSPVIPRGFGGLEIHDPAYYTNRSFTSVRSPKRPRKTSMKRRGNSAGNTSWGMVISTTSPAKYLAVGKHSLAMASWTRFAFCGCPDRISSKACWFLTIRSKCPASRRGTPARRSRRVTCALQVSEKK